MSDLEAFRTATFSGDLDELMWLLDALPELDPERIDAQRVALFGHSRGGATALLAAAADRTATRVATLVTWAAVSTFDRASDDDKARWRQEGTLWIVNGRTGQELPLGVELLDDVEVNSIRLDVAAAVAQLAVPWLLVHGSADETVPIEEARQLHRHSVAPMEYLEVDGGSHTFGARHPFSGPTRELVAALNATQVWLRRHLG